MLFNIALNDKDNNNIVKYSEILRERYPNLNINFDDIVKNIRSIFFNIRI